MTKQTTILKEVSVKGVGLHTGNMSIVIFKPAPYAGYGIRFIRVDLQNKPEVESIYLNVDMSSVIRGSVLKKDGVVIYTVEHIMSTCFALGIDNLIIEINNTEPPILDGSTKIFSKILQMAGISEFDTPKEYYIINKPVHFEHEKTKISAYPSDHLEIECTINFDHSSFLSQQIHLNHLNKQAYLSDFAPARTFCFDFEIDSFHEKGFALGGSFDNSIVVSRNGDIYNKEPLRYKDEFVRHKVLDLIGDIYLSGKPIKARIVAERPGHKSNLGFVIEFLKHATIERDESIASSGTEKILNFEEILNYIPHRPPFLMIDKVKIDTANTKKAIGYKCVSGNENFFQGHFPDAPIMPGVLIIEAMAQTSCVMFLSRPEMRGCLAYFISIDKAKFRRPVNPGDALELHVEVLKDCGRRGKVKGRAYVDGKLTTESEFMFIIVDKK
jgi:UDP-3-O-[3-hydroxymyristoyl] N-acetylglucosamine deacetylase/3-hydroxyacyl-[acyl-carrier-protein] dehydratase